MDEIMNRIGEVYEPFKVHFLHKPVRPLAPDEVLVKVANAKTKKSKITDRRC